MPRYSILHVIGARPHFMKLAPISKILHANSDFEQVVVHTGQHYDHGLSGAFLTEFELDPPQYNLGVGSDRQIVQMANMMLGLDRIVQDETPNIVFVYGDTNSTAAGAITAAKNNIPLAHVEAGLREFDKRIPEEINKLLTDIVTDLYFCPTNTAVQNLHKQGIVDRVYNVGDTVLDWLSNNEDKFQSDEILDRMNVSPGQYYFITCHRASNTDNPEHLQQIWNAIHALDKPAILPLHPRTKAALERQSIRISPDTKLKLIEPIGFWDTQMLIRHARAVLTDSGGIIKESYFHKTPSVILDTQTEWIEVVEEGWATVTGPDEKAILVAAHAAQIPDMHKQVLGGGGAARHIVKLTKNFLDERN